MLRIIAKWDGNKLHIDENKINEYLNGKKANTYYVDIKRAFRVRSISQNSYYWAVVIRYIANYTGEGVERIHETLKYNFLKIIFQN